MESIPILDDWCDATDGTNAAYNELYEFVSLRDGCAHLDGVDLPDRYHEVKTVLTRFFDDGVKERTAKATNAERRLRDVEERMMWELHPDTDTEYVHMYHAARRSAASHSVRDAA